MLDINEKTNKISLTKGDTAYITIGVEGRGILEGDVIVLSIKGTNIVKEAHDGVIEFFPSDTANLQQGFYWYDVQLTTADEEVYTIIPPSIFEICGEVSQ